MICLLRASLALVAAMAAPVGAQSLDPAVRAMVEAAARSGDPARIEAVVAVAKETNPRATAEIDAIVKAIADDRAARREAEIRAAGPFDLWKGRIDAGGALQTGNTDTRNLSLAVGAERDGLKWRHRAGFSADVQAVDGRTDQSRLYGTWQSDWRLDDRLYALGRFEYERNLDAGIRRRFVETVGIGWRAIRPAPFTWDLEAGPALRQTKFEDGRNENALAFRAASRFAWDVARATRLTNDTFLFVEEASSLQNTLALSPRLFGALSAGVSFTVLWEEEPAPGLASTSTITRLTLGYAF
ncbi:MAG: DUF481 domain-containing protein [Sphingomonadaceae bacterium]|uniref:DUF481 domain-containing protein n=1 Tax=Thermaurantiacus sp. TaxID=2820283 RepID=UPI00298F1812|nr:DUF481 domain-containing protein [Thermaurantiacus sp.]MCS6986509.1 DUF481 domain-containing protein [Sphingomonadaceae bacterium]MDW8414230.1 DUF481 domain-containing protein [Thermaurantiacus sp.]